MLKAAGYGDVVPEGEGRVLNGGESNSLKHNLAVLVAARPGAFSPPAAFPLCILIYYIF